MTKVTEPPAEVAAVLDIGWLLGENHAFGVVAARCSAAQATGIRRLREEKIYKRCISDWKEFCPKYLKMSSSHADRIIRLLEEFGPGYFEMLQLTRISPETYRELAPTIQNGALLVDGEAIELNPGNARKVATAIAEMRKPSQKRKPARLETHERLEQIDRRCTAIVADLEEISRKERCGENWLRLTAVISRMRAALTRLEIENGL